MSFTQKIISVAFTLPNGNFSGTNSNTLTVKGMRTHFAMQQVGGVTQDQAQLTIWGLTDSQIKQISTYSNFPNLQNQAQVTVQAGDASGLATVFIGTIRYANADYNGQPSVPVQIEASANHYLAVAPAKPLSFAGSADVATIMGNLAQQMNLSLENSGVTVKLSNPYFYGSAVDQVKQCAKAAGIEFYIDKTNGVLAIWPRNKSRNGGVVQIGPGQGLVGYPTFSQGHVRFRAEFNPAIFYARKVQLSSSLQPANGTWVVRTIDVSLQSETPNGDWFQEIDAWTVQ